MKIVYTWLIISLGFLVPAISQTLVQWPLTPNQLNKAESFVSAVQGFDLQRGNGLSVLNYSGSGVSAQNWVSTSGAVADADVDYYEFGLKALPGETLDISDLSFSERRSSAGPRQFRVVMSLDNFNTSVELAQQSLPDDIFSRNHQFPIDRKISNGESMRLRLYASNAESNSGSWTLLANRLKVLGTAMPACTSPTMPANIALVDVNESGAEIRLAGGNGQARLVIIAPADAPPVTPHQGDAYSGDLTFGDGDELGWQTYALTATTDPVTLLEVEGLEAGAAYRVSVFEYNLAQMCYAANPETLELETLCHSEAFPVEDVQYSNLDGQVALRWEAPNCADRFLVVASENPIVGSPQDNDYDASTTYGEEPAGPDFLPGTSALYFGSSAAAITVEGLENGTEYHLAVFTRNGGEWSSAFAFTTNPEEGCDQPFGEQVFINEFHYNNGPVAQDQGVEIAGPSGTDLSNYELIIMQVVGSSGVVLIERYRSVLSGVVGDEGQSFGAVWFPIAQMPTNRAIIYLQNRLTGVFVDAVGYDSTVGILVAASLPDVELDVANPWIIIEGLVETALDPPGFSIQRIGEGNCPQDFLWAYMPQSRGRLNAGQAILPVELGFLAAEPVSKSARIYWQTITESGSDYFILERSPDGRFFEELIKIPAAGFSAEVLDYEFYDRQPFSGQNYYRLRQVDFDGTAYELGIVSVNFAGGGKPELGIFPNPVQTQTTVQWNTPGDQLELLDMQGRSLQQWSVEPTPFGGSQALDLSAYPAGQYILRLVGENQQLTTRLVKE
ncbi:MAG: T9SS type A sorting domain-containing protein [Bacteroidota bacterium]